MSLCTTCLIRTADIFISVALALIDLLRSLSISLPLTNEFESSFHLRTIKVWFPSSCTFVTTIELRELFPRSLHCFQMDIETKYPVSKFLMEGNRSWCTFLYRQCLTDSSLLYNRKNVKRAERMHKMNHLKW